MILVVAATDRELCGHDGLVCGVGPVEAAAATSRALRVPRSPIAIPMSAVCRAGTSLTPSPVTATISPSAWSARTRSSFCDGTARAITSTERSKEAPASKSADPIPFASMTRGSSPPRPISLATARAVAG